MKTLIISDCAAVRGGYGHRWARLSSRYDKCTWCGETRLMRPDAQLSAADVIDEKFGGEEVFAQGRDDLYFGEQNRTEPWQYESDAVHLVVRNRLTGRFGFHGTMTAAVSTACRETWEKRPRRTFVFEMVTCNECRKLYQHPPRLFRGG